MKNLSSTMTDGGLKLPVQKTKVNNFRSSFDSLRDHKFNFLTIFSAKSLEERGSLPVIRFPSTII